MTSSAFYSNFQANANQVKNDFLSFLIEARRAGGTGGGYPAPNPPHQLGIRPARQELPADHPAADQRT